MIACSYDLHHDRLYMDSLCQLNILKCQLFGAITYISIELLTHVLLRSWHRVESGYYKSPEIAFNAASAQMPSNSGVAPLIPIAPICCPSLVRIGNPPSNKTIPGTAR
jgi:hypothetical protein